jgi:hypothetical protein
MGEHIFFEEELFMTKGKKFFAGMAVLLSASLFFIGCGDPSDGAAGLQGPVYLTTNASSAAIQHAIDSGAPVVFAGVVQSDAGTVTIPAGRAVELVGSAAFTTHTGGTLVVYDTSSVTGDGTLVAGGSGVLIAPSGVRTSGTVIPLQADSEATISTSGGVIAVKGKNVTISGTATSVSNISATDLSTKTLYVLDGTVTATAVLGAATIFVDGKATVDTVDQTAAVVWTIGGNLDAKKLPTVGGALKVKGDAEFAPAFATGTAAINIDGKAEFKDDLDASGNGAITVGGNLDVAGDLTTGTGALDAGGNLTVVGELTTGGAAIVSGDLAVGTNSAAKATSLGGNLTVQGTAAFSGTFTNTASATAAFYKATTITGILTTTTGALTIAGTGAVELKASPTIGASAALTVSNTGGVTLSSGISVAEAAGDLTITGNGKAIIPDTKAITITSSGTVTGGEWEIGTAGSATATGDITLTAAGISGATGAKLALAASIITVGLNGGNIGATFDGVDVYLASGSASVSVVSGSSGGDTTTLTLANGAKISGLTGAASPATAEATTTTGSSPNGTFTDIVAVTGTASNANANNYLGIKSGKTSGTIVAEEDSTTAQDFTIVITTVADADGAA